MLYNKAYVCIIYSNPLVFFKVYVDTDGENCITASFVFGGDTLEREYDIRVLQYDTTNQMGGPQGRALDKDYVNAVARLQEYPQLQPLHCIDSIET